jgi:uncharacterized protein (DUF433 family)
MGGTPCFYGTRIPVDTVRQLVDFRTIFPEDVPEMYPSLAGVDLSHTVRRP